jgi:hypothetical protein
LNLRAISVGVLMARPPLSRARYRALGGFAGLQLLVGGLQSAKIGGNSKWNTSTKHIFALTAVPATVEAKEIGPILARSGADDLVQWAWRAPQLHHIGSAGPAALEADAQEDLAPEPL